MRILTVVGTRPQLIKAAALSATLRAGHDEVFVDTGQHYDEAMAGVFFTELGLPKPDHSLGVGSGSHAEQTGAMLVALEPIVTEVSPEAILVYGDTNSTLAGALVAAKLGVPVAHVEAGLRSFDRSMPEEVNRVLVDHLSRWRFAPTPAAVENLAAEGLTDGVDLVGDLMQDLAARIAPELTDPGLLRTLRFDGAIVTQGGYLFATIHRAENRTPDAIRSWAALLRAVARPYRPVILALHPGTKAALDASGEALGPDVSVVEPLAYRTSMTLQLHAAAVLTDSGGVQREAGWLGVPCLVLRTSTEWVELVAASGGQMTLVGLDTDQAVRELVRWAPMGETRGLAAARAKNLAIPSAGAAAAIADRIAADAETIKIPSKREAPAEAPAKTESAKGAAAGARPRLDGAMDKRRRRLLAELDMLGPRSTSRVLDVGCGSGDDLDFLAASGFKPENLAGIDTRDSDVERARSTIPGAAIEIADATALPFPDSLFDATLQTGLLSSITDPDARLAVAREMARVTRPEGILISSDRAADDRDANLVPIDDAEVRRLFGSLGTVRGVTLGARIANLVAGALASLLRRTSDPQGRLATVIIERVQPISRT